MNSLKRFFVPRLLRPLMAIALVAILIFGHATPALAARSGGRMGGSAFRARPMPSRSYSRPSTPSYNRGPGGYYPGGGFGFPFLLPFFTFGGGAGSLFSILIFIAIANFLVSAFRRTREDGDSFVGSSESLDNPSVSINKLQIGVLAEARELQPELDKIAQLASTNSTEGLTRLLQETSLSLLRHPEYWAYGDATSETCRLVQAEAKFNQFALTERSKFQSETLSNVKGELSSTRSTDNALMIKSELDAPGEYILITLLVATQNKIALPNIQTSQDLKGALNLLGAVSSEQMLALEILWTPQVAGDTLTTDDLLESYPNLKIVA